MRIVGWMENWDKETGLEPAYLSDIDFHASAEELRALAQFFQAAAEEVANAMEKQTQSQVEITFPNPDPGSGLPLTVSVISGKP